MLKIEKGKRYVMVRVDKGHIGITGITVVNPPNFSSPSTMLQYRVVGFNGLCFDDSPLHCSYLQSHLCTSFEHWITLARGYAIIDSKEHALKYCRQAILWEFYRGDILPFKQNMPAYGWACCIIYQKALEQLKELKL
jgi:hypothetical protein